MNPAFKLLLKFIALALLTVPVEWLPLPVDDRAELFGRFQPLLRFLSVLLLLNIALSIFSYLYRRRKHIAPGESDTILLGLTNLYYIAVALLVLGGLISLYGIDFKTLFTSLSIIAAAIAIITRDFIVEIIAGLVMSFSRRLSVGDYISLGATKGRVTTLTLTNIVLLNEDDDLVHVPNTKVFSSELVNYTLRMQRRMNIEFEVRLDGFDTVDAFEANLVAALAEYHELIVPSSYSLRIVDIGKDAAHFKFRYTLSKQDVAKERELRRKTSRAVIDYVKRVTSAQRGDVMPQP